MGSKFCRLWQSDILGLEMLSFSWFRVSQETSGLRAGFSNICSNKFNLINGSCWVSGWTMVMMEMLVMMIMFKKIENETFFVLCFIYLANSTISREMNPSCQRYEKRWSWSGLHNSFHPTIRDGSTWSMFRARGEHGDVFLFSNLGALWFSENLIRYSLHICLREVKNNLFSFKNSYLRHFSWRF